MEKAKGAKESPSLSCLKQFLISKADYLETFKSTQEKEQNMRSYKKPTLFGVNKRTSGTCNTCSRTGNLIYNCNTFMQLNIEDSIKQKKRM